MPIFTIDGNIGSGKSTVLGYLHSHYRIPIDLEPVNKWQPYLENMYRNNVGAFEFQVRVWLDRCWIQQRPNMASIVMERSPYFQSNVFIPVNLESGRLNGAEYHMLQEMYSRSGNIWSPFGYIYLRSNPQNCYERVHQRSRPSEECISQSYLQKLHAYHEQAYFQAIKQGVPVICIDVEGKTIPAIAAEVYTALNMLGMYTVVGYQ
jgi:thymidine kinase